MGLTRINQIVSAWVCLDNLTIFSFVRVTWTHTDCFPRPPHISLIPSKCSSQAKTWSIIRNHTHSHTQTRVNRERGPTRSESQRDVRKGKNPFTCPSTNRVLIERSLIIFVYVFTIYTNIFHTPTTRWGEEKVRTTLRPLRKMAFWSGQSPCGLASWTTGLSRPNISHVPRGRR